MQDKRYQVFISSTFQDLQNERRAVQDVVISTGDFPVQMESFPAADQDQFEFIKSLIDQCDYYILIIGGRYGTVAEDGLSYTHKEFKYAVSKGVPVLVMLHGERGNISLDKSEKTDVGKKRLDDFISEAEANRLRKTWDTLDGLKLAAREALDHAKATKPRIGWVRGDAVTSLETLEELNNVRKENERFRQALGSLEIEVPLPTIPAASDILEIDLLPVSVRSGFGTISSGSQARTRTSWISVFPVFFSNLKWQSNDWNGDYYHRIDDDESCVAIGSALAGEVAVVDTSGFFKIGKGTLDRLSSFYIEAGLMTTEGESPFTETAQRVARRYRISEDASSVFVLLQGEVKVSEPSLSSHQLDDEIPF
ncbi:DUF4062 domain-containing protein [Phyllobacterium endophyticum]|uniref:DUF4062 domain-containing protein n=1 Tax=Phyllobacterium endophyticum TaxID=1149773 RepID=A0A2P7AND9_9HYPH|nr:DUF4062 domain-containing protein [Phyllobacterium endophyticum]MBB3233974.1 hypothetical protein [Phyllobacterium endophyticum]PSH55726.1 hypothetical protein CU100_18780 [Phyllobacterium endophyticum]TYR43753.1 DUF4062 domain-containing protein [Phyllobacterium endophyticum]